MIFLVNSGILKIKEETIVQNKEFSYRFIYYQLRRTFLIFGIYKKPRPSEEL